MSCSVASPAAGALRPRQPPPLGSSSLPGEDACACHRVGTPLAPVLGFPCARCAEYPCDTSAAEYTGILGLNLAQCRNRLGLGACRAKDPNPRGRAPKRRPPLAHLTEGQSQSGIPSAGSSCALPASSSDPGSQQRHPRGRRKTRLHTEHPMHIRWRRVSRDGTRRDAQWGKGGTPFRSSTESCCRSEVRDDITVSGRSEAGAWAGRVAKL